MAVATGTAAVARVLPPLRHRHHRRSFRSAQLHLRSEGLLPGRSSYWIRSDQAFELGAPEAEWQRASGVSALAYPPECSVGDRVPHRPYLSEDHEARGDYLEVERGDIAVLKQFADAWGVLRLRENHGRIKSHEGHLRQAAHKARDENGIENVVHACVRQPRGGVVAVAADEEYGRSEFRYDMQLALDEKIATLQTTNAGATTGAMKSTYGSGTKMHTQGKVACPSFERRACRARPILRR